MHKNTLATGDPPQTPLEKLTALPDPRAGFWGGEEKGWEREWEGKGQKGRERGKEEEGEEGRGNGTGREGWDSSLRPILKNPGSAPPPGSTALR